MGRDPEMPIIKLRLKAKVMAACLLASVMLWALVVGCGDNPQKTKGSTSAIQACGLLTSAEVEAIIGGAIDEPRKTHHQGDESKPWMSMCHYYSEAAQISMGVTIMPHGRNVAGREAFAQYAAELKESLGDDFVMEAVEGLGDYAGWEESTKQLTIFKDELMIIVGTISPKVKGAAALALNRQLAEKVLAKL